MARGCCDPRAPKPILLRVDGGDVGVIGLEEIFREVSRLPGLADEELAAELLSRFKVKNYVPSSAEKKYAEALLTEYKKQQGR